MKKKCLNVGCGQDYREDTDEFEWTNLDKELTTRADEHFDLNRTYRWPFGDDTFDFAYCGHIVEHMRDLRWFMEELWRVCKGGAEIWVVSPHPNSRWAWGDPTHLRAVGEHTFIFWDNKNIRENIEKKTSFSILNTKAKVENIETALQVNEENYEACLDLHFPGGRPDFNSEQFMMFVKSHNDLIDTISFHFRVVKP